MIALRRSNGATTASRKAMEEIVDDYYLYVLNNDVLLPLHEIRDYEFVLIDSLVEELCGVRREALHSRVVYPNVYIPSPESEWSGLLRSKTSSEPNGIVQIIHVNT
ncbi:hypothetical protein KIN20_033856 [Parelaphostrongylus tenuis]|uniref:Uncharacterized protein n=1 Tax=Parelaphostrongylus tenuis TaxID=148309 RepID=A0AAD5WIS3_PARTN|nr:hypothetical protein KIN20_033856 [Parelaphostrongylus tenuis]